jgi:hypothetical protein
LCAQTKKEKKLIHVMGEVWVGGGAYPHELLEEPASVRVTLYDAAVDAASAVEDSGGALAFHSFDRHRSVKLVLQEYVAARVVFGLARVTRYSEHVNNSLRPLLTSVDFVADIDVAARRAYRKRTTLLKLYNTLVRDEHGQRLNAFAQKHPAVFTEMLSLLQKELRKRRIKDQHGYFKVVRRASL